MIKLEHVVLASPEQMEFIIEGLRNPMNSWDKSDSNYKNVKLDNLSSSIADLTLAGSKPDELENAIAHSISIIDDLKQFEDHDYIIGPNDISLMQRLANAGTDHRKFMRMMPVYVRITAPLYWWKEFSTYKVGTVANSCSTMHKIHEKEFTLEDFSFDHIINEYIDYYNPSTLNQKIVGCLNECREAFLKEKENFHKGDATAQYRMRRYWWQMIQLLPSSYNQTRNVMMNYEVLANIYKSRKDHKLDEWRELCKWIETLPYSELICGPEFLRKSLNSPKQESKEE